MSPLLLTLVVALALVLAFYNGFHDASNAVSTSITTRALTESTALAMAAVLNLLGAMLGMLLLTLTAGWALDQLGLTRLAEHTAAAPDLLGVALIAIGLAAFAWEVLTWWIGMPSSTWHAVYGGTIGAAFALGAAVPWQNLGIMLVTTLVAPVIGVGLAYGVMQGVLALGRSERLRIGHLRFAQTVSAGAVAAGHGMHDARLPLALVVVATTSAGLPAGTATGLMLPVAVAMAVGTLLGGHRIIRTLGRRLTDLSAAQGLAAETSAAAVTGVSFFGLESPISTSHALASSVVGAGVAMGPRHVRWRVARTMVATWVATPLVCALAAAALTVLLRETL